MYFMSLFIDNRVNKVINNLLNVSLNNFLNEQKYPGRGELLGLNNRETSLKYPKVNPKTGIRLFERGYYWSTMYENLYLYSNELYIVDTEYAICVDNKKRPIYHLLHGWTKPGYYWLKDEYGNIYEKRDNDDESDDDDSWVIEIGDDFCQYV